MFEFFDAWSRLWYPGSLADEPGFLLPLFAIGLLSLFVLWLRIRCWWLNITALVIFLWALPALVSGVVELIMLALALLLIVGALWLLGANWDSSTPEYTAKKTGKNTWEIRKKD